MIYLMLSTGIRISECVGLDIQDIDWEENSILVVRKGRKYSNIYFDETAAELLGAYMEEREEMELESDNNALFISRTGTRITPRSVQRLVKKYASVAVQSKHITPHKLRSTYGTNLYRETGDIYLVAEVLGHNDVNTTRKHYAALDEDRKRMAAKAVSLRKE